MLQERVKNTILIGVAFDVSIRQISKYFHKLSQFKITKHLVSLVKGFLMHFSAHPNEHCFTFFCI